MTGKLLGQVVGSFILVAVSVALGSTASAQSETVLHSFNHHDGANPAANLIFDRSGRLYGTTRWGGIQNGGCHLGCGVVFELVPNSSGAWNEKVIHLFHAFNKFDHEDGAGPVSGVVFDGRGNLFGTTAGGIGSGDAFELSRTSGEVWNEHLIHSFLSNGEVDGAFPWGGLILDAAGNLYGTTQQGGSVTSSSGVVFEFLRTRRA
jgi:hypothetical protein